MTAGDVGSAGWRSRLPVGHPLKTRKSRKDFVYYLESEISSLTQLEDVDTSEVKLVGSSESDRFRLVKRLQTVGIDLKSFRDFKTSAVDNGQVVSAINFSVGNGVRRTMAKIAYNYAAKFLGASFVLSSDFDGIRRFVLDGSPSGRRPVSEGQRPILRDDSATNRQTRGHLVTLSWRRLTRELFAQVSPFNFVTYDVTLAAVFTGIWREIRIGHLFDPMSRRILPLQGVRDSLIPVSRGFASRSGF